MEVFTGRLARTLAPPGGPWDRFPVSHALSTVVEETPEAVTTLVDTLIEEQAALTAVDQFSRWHGQPEGPDRTAPYRRLLPATPPGPGRQYAFEVDLDRCSGCKSCVTACHALNGLEEEETWRSVGLLISLPPRADDAPGSAPPESLATRDAARGAASAAGQQHVTTACHHCVDPGCLNGCPVLAYDKDPVTGIVRHLDDQCMGCGYCVMKCPYEVPRYSRRLGIVRKCDLCHGRLAANEAPACAQACPHEAIRITVADPKEIALAYRGDRDSEAGDAAQPNRFLPASPDPAFTLPSTRYLGSRRLEHSEAADRHVLRLDSPHWPLVIMLVLTQAAAGLFLVGWIMGSAGDRAHLTPLHGAGLGLLLAGLGAAVFHLGQPRKAWRSFLGWRTSWLSREAIAFHLFAGVATLTLIRPWIPGLAEADAWFSALSVLAGLGAVCASAMVYVDTGRPLWVPRITFGNFLGTTFLLGATFAAVVLGWSAPQVDAGPLPAMQGAAFAALFIRAGLFAWRRIELRTARRDPASPIHWNVRAIRELLPWTTPVRTWLFVASTALGLCAWVDIAGSAVWWATLAALTTFGSEVIGRYVFFAAGTARRMPGGIAS